MGKRRLQLSIPSELPAAIFSIIRKSDGSLALFKQPRRDGGKSPIFSTQILDCTPEGEGIYV